MLGTEHWHLFSHYIVYQNVLKLLFPYQMLRANPFDMVPSSSYSKINPATSESEVGNSHVKNGISCEGYKKKTSASRKISSMGWKLRIMFL